MLRLKEIRSGKMTQNELSKKLNVSQNTISRWESGERTIDVDNLNKISELFNVSTDYILGKSDFKTMKEAFDTYKKFDDIYNPDGKLKNEVDRIEKGIKIPVLGNVAAGIPIEAIQNYEGYEYISKETYNSEFEYFALKIQGNSMMPKFSEGDVVIVRKQPDLENGDIGVVMVNSHDATVKKVIKQEDGLLLISSNQNYEPKFYNHEEISNLPVEILGKVIELRAKF